MILIGMATFAIMTFPIWINSSVEKLPRERVSVNQVPQKTPVTSIKRTSETMYTALNFIY